MICFDASTVKTLRSIQSKSNASLRQSCLSSRSANKNQTHGITEAASDAEMDSHLRSGGSSHVCLKDGSNLFTSFPVKRILKKIRVYVRRDEIVHGSKTSTG